MDIPQAFLAPARDRGVGGGKERSGEKVKEKGKGASQEAR
jgi:hypothetical protein